jgi:hypothetical protein
MKTSIKVLITLLITASSLGLKAQSFTGGIYLTEQDYKANKLSYVLKDNDKLHLNDFLGGKNVSVTNQGKTIKLSKNEIFGYRLKNEDYRFFNNIAYKIIDTKDFYIFSRPKLTQQGKGLKPVDTYYFSSKANEVIEPLTISNLASVYAQNPKFKYTVEQQFKSDNELIAYDEAIKEYKLKYLFDQSTK